MKRHRHSVQQRVVVESDDFDYSVTSDDVQEKKDQCTQRAEKMVQFYKEKIQRQLSDYNKVRNEEQRLLQEQNELKALNSQLDKKLEALTLQAAKGAQKDSFMHTMFNEMMTKENPEVKMTSEYLKKTMPITEELFETLNVTTKTEKQALDNLSDIEASARTTLQPLVQQRTLLEKKLNALRDSYDTSQEMKRSLFEQKVKSTTELDCLNLELDYMEIRKKSNT
ncbi:unnamed protein product [Bursaphelenchus okinawaensis]|uniref:Uncharacterized protein n=1 Tax=Bursaphelenchus okinawaensis TaxID=465554 RepID=A0A811LE50_9BILA|nr:unnamed protein product [Bursaphelenchus okinawaensis]CAG9120892.1 unnamed protein product [Bursaphelenchus okinawaensis]